MEHVYVGLAGEALVKCSAGLPWATCRIAVDPPRDTCFLSGFENSSCSERVIVVGVTAGGICVTLRRCREHIGTVHLRPAQKWSEPAIRCGEITGHEVVVIQILIGEVTHTSITI